MRGEVASGKHRMRPSYDYCDIPSRKNSAITKRNQGRQLLRLELSALLVLEAGVYRGSAGRDGEAAGGGDADGYIRAHPVLPEALSFLLFQSLYGQGFGGDSRVH